MLRGIFWSVNSLEGDDRKVLENLFDMDLIAKRMDEIKYGIFPKL